MMWGAKGCGKGCGAGMGMGTAGMAGNACASGGKGWFPKGGQVPFVSRASLLEQARKVSSIRWFQFCEKKKVPIVDVKQHDDEFLKEFLQFIEDVMEWEETGGREEDAEQVKKKVYQEELCEKVREWQRRGLVHQEAWHAFCGGVSTSRLRDPRQHTVESLETFVRNIETGEITVDGSSFNLGKTPVKRDFNSSRQAFQEALKNIGFASRSRSRKRRRKKSSSSDSSSSSRRARKDKKKDKKKRKVGKKKSTSSVSSNSSVCVVDGETKSREPATGSSVHSGPVSSPAIEKAKSEALAKLMKLREMKEHSARMREWRALLRAWHPDKNPDNLEVATAVFKFLQKGKALFADS